jgi:hypothetical protein
MSGCRTSDGGPIKRVDVEIMSLFSPIGVDCGNGSLEHIATSRTRIESFEYLGKRYDFRTSWMMKSSNLYVSEGQLRLLNRWSIYRS